MIPLLILGLLKQFPGAHGYELLALMEERHYKYIVNFTKGSFYYNLQQLEDKQCIRQKKVSQTEKGREAHHYEITPLGQKNFEDLMHKFGTKTDYINLSFYGAMLFSDDFPPEQFNALVKSQIAETNKKIALLDLSIDHHELLPSFKKMLENSRAHHRVNLEWFDTLLKPKTDNQ
ncbi:MULTISPECIES: PadR family transcriptional regulator [Brochothrix]|uniref:PadR family transcriptional regulator n=1 Tax=Brochothrix TaxID=2755 RepID=UPI00083FB6EA|nr:MULTISPECIES: helix-turn-helix transcriptional regulator [Brochothrix]ANZ96041.1 PadR family transcriptional regulator [Brochothrix thermosphacta]ANZ97806.1 PadR family transcriptional regulator [Brochothrix thermosphacta]MBR5525338.1 PadR family transcriptional regulator [Brochothrix sp.]MDO7863211.1 helix-turn-helix transcriptional regulator [Brochothrix thermosphacta]ODJ51981.1 PadR family transcriptional regulator [Brochothrix thermosphacta]